MEPKAGGTHLPITPLMQRAIAKVLLDAAFTDYQNILLWAACCVGFFMQSGEFILTSTTAFDPTCHLSIQDVAVDSHSNRTLVQLHLIQLKTDQFYQRTFIYPFRTCTDLCPVSALLALPCNSWRCASPPVYPSR